jgi:hypothetical protein
MKILFLGILLSANCFAWGPTGHRVVGEIAERGLSAEAFLKIMKIGKGQSLPRMATWPDEIKSEPATYSGTFNWHYTDWADDQAEHNEEHSAGVLIKSIREQIAILKNEKADDAQKEVAIKFLVHLVGDLHMPLHVGNGLDMGGNNCKVIFHGKPTNLHALWDEGMIDFTNLSFTELARFVSQGRQVQARAWRSGDIVDWALESKNIRTTIYPNDTVAPSTAAAVKQYCRKDVAVTTADMPNLAFDYSYKFMPVVEQRLYQAGIRLAMLLNDALK